MPRLVPEAWMPQVNPGQIRRIIVHWSGGANFPSAEDFSSYNILCDRVGHLHLGDHPITEQISTADDDYAAHTRGLNTGSIGFAYCGMAGANERPSAPGPYPIQKAQWNSGLVALADLCRRYDFPPLPKFLCMHCEAPSVHGVSQKNKWDVSVLYFDRGRWAGLTPGEEMRARVAILLSQADE